MFPGFGTTLNIAAIIIGSVIGILIGKKLSEKLMIIFKINPHKQGPIEQGRLFG